ncbi:MAG: lytic transglycosylase domain-containing protein, partial [Rubrobacter sp.]|nr:lytic transglycosylase domain-containing protein [Rubrobacter sp.]
MSWTLRIVLLVLQSKKGRRLLLLAITGVVAAALMLFVAMTGAVASVFSSCKEQMESLSSSSSGDYPSSSPSQEASSDIPEDLLGMYQQYAEEYGVDWALVAAVGKQESNHGQDYSGCATSEDNAQGLMQFIPSTWASEGVDGNGDGNKDPCDDEDAIASGASYLANLGAADDERGALCSYYGACGDANANYADEVMAQAEAYRGSEEGGGSSEGSGEENSGEETSGGASGLIPPLLSRAYAAGVSDTPSGWSLVEPDKTMTYYSESRFDSYVEAAAKEWDAIGGVDIQPAESAEEANLVFRDVPNSQWQYGWAMGYTKTTDPAATKGEIVIKAEEAEGASETV